MAHPDAGADPALAERVAALEAALTFACISPPPRPLTEAEMDEIKEQVVEAARLGLPRYFIPSPPPLTPEQVRQLLRECVTVVKPGETLILRIPWSVTPTQVRELQDFATYTAVELDLPFKVLVLPGDELAVTDAGP